MIGETNRLPFDLPEAEGELVAGHMTEYSSMKFAWFFLAEYINMATVSGVATTLFLGGWHAPWPINVLLPALDGGWWGLIWFILKTQVFIAVFIWLRGTLPRFRYDQFMDLGWKWLIPISLVWIVFVAILRALGTQMLVLSGPLSWVLGGALVVVILAMLFLGERVPPDEPQVEGPFDAFAGGYPVPPAEGEVLPELAGVVPSEAETAQTDAAGAPQPEGVEA